MPEKDTAGLHALIDQTASGPCGLERLTSALHAIATQCEELGASSERGWVSSTSDYIEQIALDALNPETLETQ